MAKTDRNKPLYMISVAADLAGLHPQTLQHLRGKGPRVTPAHRVATRVCTRKPTSIAWSSSEDSLTRASTLRASCCILDRGSRMREMQEEADRLREEVERLHEAMHELELRRTITTLMSRPDHSKLLSGGLSDI